MDSTLPKQTFHLIFGGGYTNIIIKNTKIWTIINDSGGFVIKSNSVGSCQVKPTLQLFCSSLLKSTNNALHSNTKDMFNVRISKIKGSLGKHF